MKAQTQIALLLLLPAASLAQVPVDDAGQVIGNYETQAGAAPVGDANIPRLSQVDLQELVGPIALYPDDLLAIVLPAAAYPLQIVEAARFLKQLESDQTLKPNAAWDDAIVALLNYPEVVDLLNEDLDWTLRLGEAVVVQQADVVSAVEAFRDRAYAAGNLKSDSYQTVSRGDDDVIYIAPVAEDAIYVPYYEPAQVVYYQPRPVYHYYPRSYPVYYYPYSAGHYFDNGYFWGVTTAFSIGWMTDSLDVYHHSYRGHPYYGYSYYNNWWYRQPSISVYNTTYVGNLYGSNYRQSHGDRWRPRESRREYTRREGYARSDNRSSQRTVNKGRRYEPISFRDRGARTSQRSHGGRTLMAQNRSGSVSRSNHRQQRPTVQSRSSHRRTQTAQTRSSHRQTPTAQTRSSHRQTPTAQTRSSHRQEAPAARTQRAPAPREHRQAEPRSGEQPSQASRGQERHSSNSGRSERRSSEGRSGRSERRSSEGRSRSHRR